MSRTGEPTIEQEFAEALRKSAALARRATFMGYKSATLLRKPSIWETKPPEFFSVFWRPLWDK